MTTRKIEFIESYIREDGSGDYNWNDNHGELIRCRDCKYWSDDITQDCVQNNTIHWKADEFCSKAESREHGSD